MARNTTTSYPRGAVHGREVVRLDVFVERERSLGAHGGKVVEDGRQGVGAACSCLVAMSAPTPKRARGGRRVCARRRRAP